MKKILILISFMISYNCFSTTLIIDNQRQNERFMWLYVGISNIPSNQSYHYYFPGNDWEYFVVQPGQVFEITDNNYSNRQFPFLNTFPFAGNVYYNGGGSGIVNLPLPPTSQNVNTSSNTTRLQLSSFRYKIDGMHPSSFMVPMIPGGGAYLENHTVSGTLNLLPNNPNYGITYMRFVSFYYLEIS